MRSLPLCIRRMAYWLRAYIQSAGSFEEPERTGCLAGFERSMAFIVLSRTAILSNAIFVAYTTDHDMKNPGSRPTAALAAIDAAFVFLFSMEAAIKLLVHRQYYFCNEDMRWNIFDLLLVVFSIIDTSMTLSSMNANHLRSFHLFKFAKVLRILRTFEAFADLRMMMTCVLGTVSNLLWCLLMLFFFIYIFAVFIVQGLSEVVAKEHDVGVAPHPAMEEVQLHFGSVGETILTLLESTTGGVSWEVPFGVLRQHGPLLSVLFIAYICFFVVAAFNIITSMFIGKALQHAQPDIDRALMEQNHRDIKDARELMDWFREADVDGSKTISMEEFKRFVHDDYIRAKLHLRGIHINDARVFYEMLHIVSEGDEVDFRTCVTACLRMRGVATSLDLHCLIFETKRLSRRLDALRHDVMGKLQELERGPRRPKRHGHDPRSRRR